MTLPLRLGVVMVNEDTARRTIHDRRIHGYGISTARGGGLSAVKIVNIIIDNKDFLGQGTPQSTCAIFCVTE